MTHLLSHQGFQGAVLGAVQGLAEFLPISSSAHLILVRWILGWSEFVGGPVVEKAFDVMLHGGTFVALLLYFWKDLVSYWNAFFGKEKNLITQRLVWMLIISTVPGALFGVLFETAIETRFSQPKPIAVFLISLGVVLAVAEILGKRRKDLDDITWTDAVLIGIGQAFALLPGVSRSGITMTVALLLGLNRETSATYSFLMSIPIIGGAVIWEGHKLLKMHLPYADVVPFGWGFLTSAVVGYFCIRYFLRYISRGNFYPFVIYRIVVGAIILFLI